MVGSRMHVHYMYTTTYSGSPKDPLQSLVMQPVVFLTSSFYGSDIFLQGLTMLRRKPKDSSIDSTVSTNPQEGTLVDAASDDETSLPFLPPESAKFDKPNLSNVSMPDLSLTNNLPPVTYDLEPAGSTTYNGGEEKPSTGPGKNGFGSNKGKEWQQGADPWDIIAHQYWENDTGNGMG